MCDRFLCDSESNIINYVDETGFCACDLNMDLRLRKLDKDVFIVLTWLQNDYLNNDSGKSHHYQHLKMSFILSFGRIPLVVQTIKKY